jgi:hypothetical protein
MTRCTCLWRSDLSARLLPDPECPSTRHIDNPEPVGSDTVVPAQRDEPLRLPVGDREPQQACACVSWCGCGRRW